LIDRILSWVAIAAENGLFKNKDDQGVFQNIQDTLVKASEQLTADTPNSLAECSRLTSFAIKSFSDVLYSKGNSKWRFDNMYAGDVWLYLIGFLGLIFVIYYFDINTILSNRFHIPLIAIDATIWGVIGGILRGVWYLWTNINDRNYRQTWRIWFFSCPFLGGILGALVYIIIIAGLLVISQQPTPVGQNQQLVVIGFCALAGYNWDWAVKRFQKIGEMV
jgi:hypothetical protein